VARGRIQLYTTTTGSTTFLSIVSWSTDGSTETNADTTVRGVNRTSSGYGFSATMTFTANINVTTPTTFTMIGAATSSLTVQGSYLPTQIKLVCAYL